MSSNTLEFNRHLPTDQYFGELAAVRTYDDLTIGSAREYEQRMIQVTKLGEGTSLIVSRWTGDEALASTPDHAQDTTLFD